MKLKFFVAFYAILFCAFTSAFAEEEIRIVKINDSNFEAEIMNSKQPIILEFSSTSCPPCLIMISTLISIAKNHWKPEFSLYNFLKVLYHLGAFPEVL